MKTLEQHFEEAKAKHKYNTIKNFLIEQLGTKKLPMPDWITATDSEEQAEQIIADLVEVASLDGGKMFNQVYEIAISKGE